ncbi:MAG: hypothetical protein ACD_39C00035G0002 [uncultured bacterium]|nr:MAG: hypothetical protein ACD_39C00035G0002 [uncultured bacterium]
MKILLDCVPCFIRQMLDATRMVSEDQAIHARVLREILQWAGSIDLLQPAPVIGQLIHRQLRQILGVADPYRTAKDRQNRMAQAMLPALQKKLESAADPLNMAMRLAIAGNVIDLGMAASVSEERVKENIEKCLSEPLVGAERKFSGAAAKAQKILYLTDNAGEIAFDRLLIEQLGPDRVTVAVRGGPVINDATLPDAVAVGLSEITEVIDNGSDAPGTILSDCSSDFRRRFNEADMIIAKGQGNFKTLGEEPGNIYFLFKAKCKLIAEYAQVGFGDHVVINREISPSVRCND